MNRFKRQLAIAFLFLPLVMTILSVIAYSEETLQKQPIGPFGGLNNVDDPYTIPANKSPDLLNVDLTPDGKSIKKRKGYGVTWTLAIPTTSVRGVYNFFNSDGESVDLYFNDKYGYASVDGATPVTLFSTGTFGATYQCVDAAGFAYCANTERTSILKIDGENDTPISTVRSTGTLLAITPERLVHAGFASEPSRVDFSNANDFSEWQLGADDDDPISFTIVAPGAKLTHIVYAHGRVYWFKTNSFGFILEGPTHDDWVVRTINPEVGTLFNTSVFRNDILYFQGQDSHWYAWDGSNLEKLSTDIDAEISTSLNYVSNSFIQTSASDFNNGSLQPSSVYVDTQTYSDSIAMTFPDGFSGSAIRNGSGGTKNVWATEGSVGVANAVFFTFGSPGYAGIRTTEKITGLQQGTTISLTVTSFPGGSGFGDPSAVFGFSPNIGTMAQADQSLLSEFIFCRLTKTLAEGTFDFQAVETSAGSFTLDISTALPIEISLYVKNGFYNFTVNGSSSMLSRTMSFPHDSAYVYLAVQGNQQSSGHVFDNFTVLPQTVTYRSAVNNAPTITTWGTLEVTKQDNGGTQTIYLRSADGEFTVNSSTPAWTQVTPGQTIGISTEAYFQFRNDFAITYGTQTPKMDDFTINWTETADSESTFAIYHDDALWWSVKSGAGQTINNRIFKLDLINKEWLRYDIAANGFLVRNKQLYFGGVSTGTINQFGVADDDAGADIEAYWKSRPYFGSSPFVNKDFRRLSFVGGGVSGTNITVDYTINGSTTTSFSVPLSRGSDLFVKRNIFFPLGTAGSTIDVKFGNDASDQPFEIFGGEIEFSEYPLFPEDN